jgi:hypothetical protein
VRNRGYSVNGTLETVQALFRSRGRCTNRGAAPVMICFVALQFMRVEGGLAPGDAAECSHAAAMRRAEARTDSFDFHGSGYTIERAQRFARSFEEPRFTAGFRFQDKNERSRTRTSFKSAVGST